MLIRLSLLPGGQWALFCKKSFSLLLFVENIYYAKFPEFTDVLFMVEKQPFSHMSILSERFFTYMQISVLQNHWEVSN